nr:small integral membrane protein 15 isoform X2 [Kogia breviceps]
MAQPETGPSTSSGRIQARAGLWAGRESPGFRLPASGLEVSWELGVRTQRLGHDVGEAGGGRSRSFAPVPGGGGHGADGRSI